MLSIRKKLLVIVYGCLALSVFACDEPPTEPVVREASVRATLGTGITDTIDAQSLQALLAEVRGSDGKLAVGAMVRFQAQPSADSTRRSEPAIFVCSLGAQNCGPISGTALAVDTTDSQGRAKALVRLGHVAGRAVIRMNVPEFGLLDSATYTVNPGAVARIRAPLADTALDIGQTVTVRGRVVDRYGNTRPELPTLSVGTGTSISVVSATGVVTAAEMGTQTLYVRFQALVNSTIVRVLPAGRLVVWSSSSQLKSHRRF